MAEEQTLRPCPLCGGSAKLWRALNLNAWISCVGTCAVLVSSEYSTDAEAIAAWNARPIEGALVEALASIEAKARELANDSMTSNRGMWLGCADEARAALAKAGE